MSKKLKSTKKQFDGVVIIMRKLSIIIADILNKINVHPNVVSVLRFVFFAIPAFVCFYFGGYIFNLIGLGLLIVNFFFDLVDGDLARLSKKMSKLGVFLEDTIDPVVLNSILFAIGLNLIGEGNMFYIIWVLVCFYGQVFSTRSTLIIAARYDIDCIKSSPELEEKIKNAKLSLIERFVLQLMTPRNTFFTLFSQFKYFLIIGVIFDIIPIVFIIYTVLINFRWLSLQFFLFYLYSKDKHRKDSLANILLEIKK